MGNPDRETASTLAPQLAAPQHGPRPLILFLDMLARRTAGDYQRMARIMAGLRAYQEAERDPPRTPMPAIAERHGASLRDYGGPGSPVLFVPSLINPPGILDLPGRSLLRWLADRGHRVLLLDWGAEIAERETLSISDHVSQMLLPMLEVVEPRPALVGYCLGGTMAIAAASLAPVPRIVTIAAPWRFSAFPAESRRRLADLWRCSEPAVNALGLLPMEVLQSAFWSLDPERTVAKFEAFAAMPPRSEQARAFVDLEDWANDGPPIGAAAARELLEDFFGHDVTGSGSWEIEDHAVKPDGLPCPALHILSTTDRIVPAASAPPGGEQLPLALGHVGMVVGGRARQALWEPLDRWLSNGSLCC